VCDSDVTVLFAEDSAGRGLGTMQVVWSSPTESYWQGLRVAPQARSLGIASLFFHVAARLCVERQGAGSIARWGVVSNNDKMTAWSQRLGLHGPQAFRRYHAEASADDPSVPLPPGFTFREVTADEVPRVFAALRTMPVYTSTFGSQNFVRAGWAAFSEATLLAAARGDKCRGIPMPPPRLLLDADGRLVAFALLAEVKFSGTPYLMYRYMDAASAAHLNVLVHQLPGVARGLGCTAVGGYIPTLPWMLEVIEVQSTVFARATKTEQHEFHWRCSDHAR
jgi:hypothetical protein